MDRPVICSAIPTLLEIANNEESALVVPPENPAALAEAVVRLVDDAALRKRLARTLHEKVAVDFTAENMAARYLAIYREALQH